MAGLSMPKMAGSLHSFLLAHLEMEKWTCFSGLLLAAGLHFALDIGIHAIGLTEITAPSTRTSVRSFA